MSVLHEKENQILTETTLSMFDRFLFCGVDCFISGSRIYLNVTYYSLACGRCML